ARKGEPQDVELPLDQNRPLRLAHGMLRDVQVVEQFALVEDRRVRRVQILGLSRAEDASAERDDARADIVNREQQATPESGPHPLTLLWSNDQPRLEQHFLTHAQSFHRIEEGG